jgi:hypothetical protein
MNPPSIALNSGGFGAAALMALVGSYPWISCYSGCAPATVAVGAPGTEVAGDLSRPGRLVMPNVADGTPLT